MNDSILGGWGCRNDWTRVLTWPWISHKKKVKAKAKGAWEYAWERGYWVSPCWPGAWKTAKGRVLDVRNHDHHHHEGRVTKLDIFYFIYLALLLLLCKVSPLVVCIFMHLSLSIVAFYCNFPWGLWHFRSCPNTRLRKMIRNKQARKGQQKFACASPIFIQTDILPLPLWHHFVFLRSTRLKVVYFRVQYAHCCFYKSGSLLPWGKCNAPTGKDSDWVRRTSKGPERNHISER
jgi:hypothetical protein